MLPLADSRDGTVYLVLDPLCVVGAGRARESSPEPMPMATLSYDGVFGDNAGGATPRRQRPSTRPSRR